MRPSFLFAALVVVVVAGCGNSGGGDAPTGAAGDGGGRQDAADGDAPSSACQTVPTCGGDPVGTWNVTTSCLDVDVSSFTADCPLSIAQAVGYKVTGTITYNADLTYSLMSTLSGKVVVTLPAPCLIPPNGIQVACEQLQVALLAPGTYQSVTCVTATTSGCICTLEMIPQSSWGTGHYTTDGAALLTETDSAGSASQRHYCVTGDATMALSPYPGSAMMGPNAMVSGSITLTKQ